MTAMEIRFLRRNKGITRKDRATEQLNIKPIKRTIEKRQFGWLGHLHRMSNNRTAKENYESRIQKK